MNKLTWVGGALPVNRADLVKELVDRIVMSMTNQDLEEFVMDKLYDHYTRIGDEELKEALDIYGVEG